MVTRDPGAPPERSWSERRETPREAPAEQPHTFLARAGADIPKTGDRELFLLTSLSFAEESASFIATPHPRQDSSRMSTLQVSHALIRRQPFQEAARVGDVVEVLPLTSF